MTWNTLSPAEEHIDLYASARHLNTQLAIALAVAGVIILGLLGLAYSLKLKADHATVVFVRVDELGRHDTLAYDEATMGTPQANEVLSDLRTFVIRYFSRRHVAVSRDFPESLFFLDPALLARSKREVEPEVKTFIAALNAEETDIVVKQTKLLEFHRQPFKAQIDFEQQYYQPGGKIARKPPAMATAIIEFTVGAKMPAAYIPVNPFGLQITYLRVDPAIPS